MLTAADGKNIYLVGGGTLGHGNQQLENGSKALSKLTENNGEKNSESTPPPS